MDIYLVDQMESDLVKLMVKGIENVMGIVRVRGMVSRMEQMKETSMGSMLVFVKVMVKVLQMVQLMECLTEMQKVDGMAILLATQMVNQIVTWMVILMALLMDY